jgi:hypothetical protein
MGANSDLKVRLAITQDVRMSDFAELLSLLRARGLDVSAMGKASGPPYGAGGIRFPTKEPKVQDRDVRFTGNDLPMEFSPEDDRVWSTYSAPLWTKSNQFVMWMRARTCVFGRDAVAVEEDVCQALHAVRMRTVKAAKGAARGDAAAKRTATAAVRAAKKATRDAATRAVRVAAAHAALLAE